jgi:hypothetical protein
VKDATTQTAVFRKSSYSSAGNCVQVGRQVRAIAVRDSMDSGDNQVSVSPACWREFISRLKLNGHLRYSKIQGAEAIF